MILTAALNLCRECAVVSVMPSLLRGARCISIRDPTEAVTESYEWYRIHTPEAGVLALWVAG